MNLFSFIKLLKATRNSSKWHTMGSARSGSGDLYDDEGFLVWLGQEN